jgi:hypothetical protein
MDVPPLDNALARPFASIACMPRKANRRTNGEKAFKTSSCAEGNDVKTMPPLVWTPSELIMVNAIAQENGPVPPEIVQAEKTYFWMAKSIQILMILLGLTAFVASLVVATFGDTFDDARVTKSIAFVAALASGVLTLFSISRKNEDVWSAWRMLNAAILRFQYEPGFTRKQLIDTWEKAETTLGNATIREK